MKCSLSIALVFGFFNAGFCSAVYPNEPAGSALVTDWSFNALTGSGWGDSYPGSNCTISSDATAPASPSQILQCKFPTGMTDGISPGDIYYTYGNGGMDQYTAFWWKADNPFQNHPVATKLMYITNDNGNGHPFFLAMTGSAPPYQLEIVVQGSDQLDNRHLGAPYTSTWYWSCGSVLQLDRWQQIEIYVQKSTTISSRDGKLRVWVDGTLRMNLTTLNTDDSGPFSGVAIAPVFGGTGGTIKSQDDYFWFDHIRISRPNGNIANPLSVSTGSLPSAQSGKPYSATIQVTGGKAPYAWTVTAGSLLPGLSLNKTTGVISGIPATGGKCEFTVKVLDANLPPATVTKSFSIVASGTSSIPNGNQLTVNNSRLTAKPGSGSVRFQMPQLGTYSLGVHDLSGREIWRNSGIGEAVWNHGGNLKKGVYLVRAEQNGRSMTTNYCHIQ